MSVTNLFIKLEKGKPMLPKEELQLQRGLGIVGNKYKGNYTPRQILITNLATLQKYKLSPGELRENIVVSNFTIDYLKSGQLIKIGKATIRITFNCEPCGFVEILQKGLLRKIQNERGILGIVYKSGIIKLDDDIEFINDLTLPYIPYKISDRLKWLIKQLPEKKVISYKQIIESMGLWDSVCRALPALIKGLDSKEYPIHRIVNSSGELLKQLDTQDQKLKEENIEVINNKVDLKKYSWNTEGLYLMI